MRPSAVSDLPKVAWPGRGNRTPMSGFSALCFKRRPILLLRMIYAKHNNKEFSVLQFTWRRRDMAEDRNWCCQEFEKCISFLFGSWSTLFWVRIYQMCKGYPSCVCNFVHKSGFQKLFFVCCSSKCSVQLNFHTFITLLFVILT